MEYIPTRPTLKYERNERGELVTRGVWFDRGKFFLQGVEHELMTTEMNTDAPFDKIVIRLDRELKQACMHVPVEELAISIFEAYLTLPHELKERVGEPLQNEVLDRVIHRLYHLELDILGANKISKIPIRGSGDSLDFMIIIENILLSVHSKLYRLRQEGYYFGCMDSEHLDIVLVRPYN